MPFRWSFVALLAVATSASAQAPDTSLRAAVSAVAPGSTVRIETRSGLRYVAPLQGSLADGFALRDTAATSRTFHYDDISRFWVRKRAIGAGVTTGAVIGTAFGILVGLAAEGLCDSGDCGSTGAYMLTGGVIFGAMGAAGGGIVGAAIPRWSERWAGAQRASQHGPTTVTGPAAGENREVERHRIGELSVFGVGGYGGFPANPAIAGGGTPGPGLMGGAELGLAFRAGHFTFGPESSVLFGDQGVWTLGGVARVDLADVRRSAVTPYLVAGLGGAFWSPDVQFENDLLTATLGAGLAIGPRWRIEARWQPAVQNTTSDKPSLVTLAVGPRLAW